MPGDLEALAREFSCELDCYTRQGECVCLGSSVFQELEGKPDLC